ncbi:hypothetical protein C064_02046 [Brucella suis 63/252]|nr:hypothetical protein C969_02418 [Brucella canis CNGB 1172]ENQ58747.1 hypothetical protein C979_02231 [Brucella canis UK10/02]ENR15432.1 hypothetical protein C064_02046 [Brucella suis 63/252]ENR19375.1 hypothetical protein C062_02327 [Brucella suis 92/29]ENR26769.1 hypothetical protein C965_02332 [Brucella suis CNGB 786]ENS43597.1 hypothetical protein B976_02794 [Brucella canis 79/122]ENS49641.1 hypothetical protein C968_02198 [Brucella canis CNGB 513]ENT26706.1 hypothetical protein B985_0
MELFPFNGVSTRAAEKYTTSLRDMTKMPHLGVAKPCQWIAPIFGFTPKAEPFSFMPNHKLIRLYSLGAAVRLARTAGKGIDNHGDGKHCTRNHVAKRRRQIEKRQTARNRLDDDNTEQGRPRAAAPAE